VSPRAHSGSRRIRRPRIVWPLVGLMAVVAFAAGIDRAFRAGETRLTWPPKPCVVSGIRPAAAPSSSRSRTKPNGRTVGLRVVVVPALLKPRRKDAVAYLAGGPGNAATEQAVALNLHRDILLVDQRGTGGPGATEGSGQQTGSSAR
jgi:pimeloyl-ACP methyl ester carboxylesterase